MDESFLVETALRDMRNLEVINALEGLVMLPQTKEQLGTSLANLNTVQRFINRLPDQLQNAAKVMFIDHGRLIESYFRAHQGAPTAR